MGRFRGDTGIYRAEDGGEPGGRRYVGQSGGVVIAGIAAVGARCSGTVVSVSSGRQAGPTVITIFTSNLSRLCCLSWSVEDLLRKHREPWGLTGACWRVLRGVLTRAGIAAVVVGFARCPGARGQGWLEEPPLDVDE